MNFVNARLPSSITHARRQWKRQLSAFFLIGFVVALLVVRTLPPAPAFSSQLGRATYWQSYENSYFATVRAYEAPIAGMLANGDIPVVVFGESSIRGTGAVGNEVWTRILERRLQFVEPRVRVVNYAQNAGDLMGPFLYHHLQRKYPDAFYIVQLQFPGEVGVRHPFHFWLTSEIALRDGKENPAANRSYATVPVTAPEERYAFVFAGLNIATNYLDVGNWVRYLWIGRSFFDLDRKLKIQPLRDVAESDIAMHKFTPPAADVEKTMREIFSQHISMQEVYLQRPLAERVAYFAEMFPSSQRSHLLLLTRDFNPYYAPRGDEIKIKTWLANWTQLRTDMMQIEDLRWVSLTGSDGELQIDDFIDLGHLTSQGQRRLANVVADNLLGSSGWFGSIKEVKK